MTDRCDFYQGAAVQCGGCGKRQDFAKKAHGPDALAREAGWTIEWRPRPYVRCPKCRSV